jgi:hypothetical protein
VRGDDDVALGRDLANRVANELTVIIGDRLYSQRP